MSEHRIRSRSPYRSSHSRKRKHSHESKSRSRSPHHHETQSNQHKHSNNPLPLNAAPLSKHDLPTYRPLFTLYLDIQKNLDIEDLPAHEVKGRWKSFVKKWNSGDLARGWYDVETFEKARRNTYIQDRSRGNADDSEDEFGPNLPDAVGGNGGSMPGRANRKGPTIPSAGDIRLRDEQAREDDESARDAYTQNLRAERKADRQVQKERLDELVPRAEAGSRERQLEKKRELAASNRAFAATKDVGGDVELRDADVMGDEDSYGELKKMKEAEQRKRTEREVKREEILRTRVAEREQRMKGLRDKEAKTMEMLKGIARARFGGGESGE